LPTQAGLHFWPDFSFIKGIRIDYLSPTLYFSDILIFLFLLSFLSRNLLERSYKIASRRRLIVCFVILFLGVIFSINFFAGIYGLIKLFEFSLFTLALAKNIQKERFRFILPALTFGILFESILATIQFQNEGSLGGLLYFLGERSYNGLTPNIANASVAGELILRPYGTFSHPNVLAGYLVISMLILTFFLSKNLRQNMVSYVGLLAGTAALMLSMSRVAIIVWLFSLGLLFLRKINRVFLLVPFIAILLIIFPQLLTRFAGLSLNDTSFLERVNLLRASTRMILENPFFGVGINNFLNNLPAHYKGTSQVIILQPVHNIILLTISQIGLIAGGIVSYYLMLLFKKTSQSAKYLLIAILCLGFFDHYFLTLQQGQLLLSLVLGISIAGLKRTS
jgi:O-antigen ligase